MMIAAVIGSFSAFLEGIMDKKQSISKEKWLALFKFVPLIIFGLMVIVFKLDLLLAAPIAAFAAIIVYMLSERMRHEVKNWQMTEAEQTATLHHWMVDSVKDARPLLERGGFICKG
jgi:hypothetical protein